MKILVTGSAGHLGEALMRLLQASPHEAVGVDLLASPYTTHVGDIAERAFVRGTISGVDAVLHTATLHKPHVATHAKQAFVDTNITGTLNLLEAALTQGCRSLIFTSTTSPFGHALVPAAGEPAAWITEDVRPIPKNIYGVTKTAAEDLCELFQRKHGLPVLVLKTSRFFPEADDNAATRDGFDDLNAKVNELLYRRLDVEDAARAHLVALERAEEIGFGRYILSATSPFTRDDLGLLRTDPAEVVRRHVDFEPEYAKRGWRLFESIDRVYDNAKARPELGWEPVHTFGHALECLRRGVSPFSALMQQIGCKGYHPGQRFEGEPFPVD